LCKEILLIYLLVYHIIYCDLQRWWRSQSKQSHTEIPRLHSEQGPQSPEIATPSTHGAECSARNDEKEKAQNDTAVIARLTQSAEAIWMGVIKMAMGVYPELRRDLWSWL